MGEKCKISIRNIRRDANDELKKLLKSKEIGEDEEKTFEKNVQTIFYNVNLHFDEVLTCVVNTSWIFSVLLIYVNYLIFLFILFFIL